MPNGQDVAGGGRGLPGAARKWDSGQGKEKGRNGRVALDRAHPRRPLGYHGKLAWHGCIEAAAAGASVNGEHGDETSRRSVARGEKIVELTRTRRRARRGRRELGGGELVA